MCGISQSFFYPPFTIILKFDQFKQIKRVTGRRLFFCLVECPKEKTFSNSNQFKHLYCVTKKQAGTLL